MEFEKGPTENCLKTALPSVLDMLVLAKPITEDTVVMKFYLYKILINLNGTDPMWVFVCFFVF